MWQKQGSIESEALLISVTTSIAFFMAMESERLKLINNHKLKEQKENLIKVAKCTLKNSQEFQATWLACF